MWGRGWVTQNDIFHINIKYYLHKWSTNDWACFGLIWSMWKLDAKQSGFRSGHSTETALLSLPSTSLVESYLTGRSFKVAWGGVVSKAHQLVTGVPQGSVSWTPPLLHIHYITGSHHTGTWLLLPFLRWWHTALSLISTRWSNGSCTDLRLLGRHLGRDERNITYSSTWQRLSFLSSLPLQFYSTT